MTGIDRSPKRNADLDCQRIEWERNSTQISPPPMKRQPNAPHNSQASTGIPSPTGPSLGSQARGDETRRSNRTKPSGKPYSDGLKAPLHVSERARQSFSSSDHLHAAEYRLRHDSPISRKSSATRANIHSDAVARCLGKPVCLICSKSTNVKYDPMITCPSCHKNYHDSCRSPPLIEGVDPQRWRCIKCCNAVPRRTSSIPTAPRAFFSNRLTPTVERPSLTSKSYTNTIAEKAPAAFLDAKCSSVESRKTSKRGDQQSYLVLADTNRHTIELDGSADQQELSHERPPPELEQRPNLEDLSLLSSNAESSKALSNSEGACESTNRPSKNLGDFTVIESHMYNTERSEVPNTPTQRSSQLDIPNSFRHPQGCATGDVPERLEISVLLDKSRSQTITSATVLCSRCQKQRVLAKKDADEVICRGSQKQSLIRESRKLEIPETPELISSNASKVHDDSSGSVSGPLPISQPAEEHSPLPWFRSGLVATPKMVQKKVYLHKQNRLSHSTEQSPLKLSEHSIGRTAPLPPNDLLSRTTHSQGDDHQLPRSPQCGMVTEVTEHSASSAPMNDIHSTSATVPGLEVDMGNPVASESEQSPSDASTWTGSRSIAQVPPEMSEWNDSNRDISPNLPSEKRYTPRQLARIALVAANGLSMTTSQILLWIAHNFPHLQVGEGSWENSVRSTLSSFPQFNGSKIDGAHRGKKLYGFTSADVRTRYEAKYSEYRVTSSSHNPSVQNELNTTKRGAPRKSAQRQNHSANPVRKAKKSAPSLNRQPQIDIATKRFQPQVQALEDRIEDMTFNPFERTRPPPSPKFLVPDGVKRHARPQDVPIQKQKPSIETMSEAEKAQKIAEIKARPSRKTFFGPNHRLAHKRRLGLQDIHDESDGAWKPPGSTMNSNQSDMDQNMDVDEEDEQTLKAAFGLPDNAIPMNDGQTELAFRDGTLVNGRLPRPRNVYKVGKLFGGDLTIRTT